MKPNSNLLIFKKRLIFIFAALAAISSITTAHAGGTSGKDSWTIEQLTFTVGEADSNSPVVSGNGRWIAFESAADLTGDNSDLSVEVYLYDTRTRQFRQLSNGVGIGEGSVVPDISINGRFVAFQSTDDLTGNNSDANDEIFVFDRATEIVSQITNTVFPHAAKYPSISATGRWIALVMEEGVTTNIGLYDQSQGKLTAVTNTPSTRNVDPDVSGNGKWIAFVSNADLIPGKNQDGSKEVFLYNRVRQSLQQVTSLDADVELLEDTSLSVNGRFLAFGSTANLTSNLNSDGNIYDSEIFVFDRKRGAIRQITDTEFPRFPGDPRISANGRRVVFGLREPNRVINIVLFDVTTTEFTRITDHPIGESTNASISANGRSIVFASNVDLTGENPDGNFEIFLAREGSNSSVPWEWAAD